jgi:hypothetical protein
MPSSIVASRSFSRIGQMTRVSPQAREHIGDRNHPDVPVADDDEVAENTAGLAVKHTWRVPPSFRAHGLRKSG